jgi:hypothetical protein
LLARYLKEPDRQPTYRRGRRHASFVTNLPLDRTAIKSAVEAAWRLIVRTPCPLRLSASRASPSKGGQWSASAQPIGEAGREPSISLP